MDILTSIQGLSFTLPDLYTQITQNGWEIKKVKFDRSQDGFVAIATNPHGEEMQGEGPSELRAVSNLLLHVVHRNGMRMGKISMWTHTFTDQLTAVAEAYSKAPMYEPKAAIAFMELARDSENRAKALMEHLEILMVNDPEPYTSAEKMCDDIRKRRKLQVSKAGINHPIWSTNQVIAYRIVHDVLGHCASGGGFDWEGENRAFAAHAAILPVEAQKALFTESIGSTAYATYYRAYGPLKVALFPEFMDTAQDKENPHGGYRGVHPSQSHPPVVEPSVKPLLSHLSKDARIEFKTAQSALRDPNEGWQSGVAPLAQNAYLDHGDPLQSSDVMNNAGLINTEWAYLNQNNQADLERMKLAITNAFRAVLLSPRKDLRWNAVHYQDIAHIPANEDDPDVYWNALEKSRQEWNVARYGEDHRFKHIPYHQEGQQIQQLEFQKNRHKGWQWAQEQGTRKMRRWMTQEQNKVMREDEDLPEDKQRHMYQIENEANKRLQQRMKAYLKEHQLGFDFARAAATAVNPDQQGMDFQVPEVKAPDMAKYGAWMGTHLQAIAKVSQHVDDVLKAALFDVHEKDGSGHHFRAAVLQLDIPGVGPKVCSFAWLLLQPLTSQLATIDTHMMDVLGHHYENDMSPRDYFKYERELAAGRDAAGYGHVPLGSFQWGMWDLKRTGPGSHQDHSAMKVLDPLSHESVDWASKQQNLKAGNWPAPDWWEATRPAREGVANDFDQTVGANVPQTRIPYNNGAPYQAYSKVAASSLTPWLTHPETGERLMGLPGQTIAQHAQTLGLSLQQLWSLEAGKSSGTIAKVAARDWEYDADDRRVDRGDYERFLNDLRKTPYGDLSRYCSDKECHLIAPWLQEKYPDLKSQAGLYVHPERGGGDHAWNVAPDGTIVDATGIQHAPDHPVLVPPDSPLYNRYVSWGDPRFPEVAKGLSWCPYCLGEKTPGEQVPDGLSHGCEDELLTRNIPEDQWPHL